MPALQHISDITILIVKLEGKAGHYQSVVYCIYVLLSNLQPTLWIRQLSMMRRLRLIS